ncbi:diphosphomevalonate decarboxylase [Cryptococcus sp. DSM 104549]
MVYEATATAPVNIACIKYWGKRDTALILPTNSSLSVTLDQDHLRSTTTSRADASFEAGDRLWLNGKEETIKEGGRLSVCIRELRKWRKEVEEKDVGLPKLSEWPLRIASYNNFPTAAGLASSASGLAALVSSLSKLYNLPQTPSQLSLIARQGSGSACRSLFGGFVAWREGTSPDGSDSLAEEVAPREHWPEMHALICVVSDAKKGTSSTSGMQRTVETSALLQERLRVVPGRMDAISKAILARDFESFAKLTMVDSNSFHAVCLDTSPPIFYLNDVSRAIIAVVEELNRAAGRAVAAYTFDAGPNAVLYALEKDMPQVLGAIKRFFPTAEETEDPFKTGVRGLPEGFQMGVVREGGWEKGAVKSLIHTRVGDGPRVLERSESLLADNGLPKVLA